MQVEKVVVKIGMFGKRSTNGGEEPMRMGGAVRWLSKTFEISWKRADKLYTIMVKEAEVSAAGYATVILTYRQLARYTAKRQVEGLNKFWKYPHVNEHLEVTTKEPADVQPIELRPELRK
jgi:hypothetical protein